MKKAAAMNVENRNNETLCALYKSGDAQALEALVKLNEGLVRKYAAAYVRCVKGAFELEDLMQAGYSGLITAAKRYTPGHGTTFSTYAVFWIKHAIRREIRDNGQGIHIPAYIQDAIGRVSRAEASLSGVYADRDSRVKAVAAMTGLAASKVGELMDIRDNMMSTSSLDSAVDDESETKLGSLISDRSKPSVEDEVENRMTGEYLSGCMDMLNDNERLVLTRRYGFDGGNCATLEEVSRELRVTRERIRQIQEQALFKLRRFMGSELPLTA